MSFFHLHQNNSGGRFKGPAVNLVIEADSALEAEQIAERLGVYFDGCESGVDCRCCGDRWNRPYGDGDAEPKMYGVVVNGEEKADAFYADAGAPYLMLVRKRGQRRNRRNRQ